MILIAMQSEKHVWRQIAMAGQHKAMLPLGKEKTMEERKSGWKWFQDHWLGIIVWVIFSATVFVLPKMMTQENPIPEGFEWGGVYWWAVRLLPALAFMLPVRAGGMDWSILPTAALSALVAAKMLNAGQQGVWVALLIGLLIGILHGFLCVTLNWSSIITTLLTGSALSLLLNIIGQGEVEEIALQEAGKPIILGLAVAGALLAFVLHAATPLGTPMHKRKTTQKAERRSYFWAYVLSSLLASITGLLMLVVDGYAYPAASMVQVDYIIILLLAGCSLFFDNRVMPLIMAAAAAVLVTLFASPLGVLVINDTMYYGLLFGEFALALLCDRVYKKNYSAAFLHKPLPEQTPSGQVTPNSIAAVSAPDAQPESAHPGEAGE